MLKLSKAIALFGAISLTTCSQLAHAGAIGNTVHLVGYYPNQSTVLFDDGTAVVGPGVEYANVGGAFNLDIAANSLTLTFPTGYSFVTTTFEGFGLADVTNPFASTTLASSTAAGFTAADLSLSAGTIFVNLQGLAIAAGQNVVIDFTNVPAAAVTPEPSSLILLGTGLLGVVGVLRRRVAA